MALMAGNNAPTQPQHRKDKVMDNSNRITLIIDNPRKWVPDPTKPEDKDKTPFVSIRGVTQNEATAISGRVVPANTLVTINMEPAVWKGLREGGLGMFDPCDVAARVLTEGKPYQRRDGTTATPIRATPVWSTIRREESNIKAALPSYDELPAMKTTTASAPAQTPVAQTPVAPAQTPVAQTPVAPAQTPVAPAQP